MIRGYVSSDEDDYDDYDFGYSEPLIIHRSSSPPPLPEIQSEELKKNLHSALEKSQQVELFLKAVSDGDLSTLEELIGLDISPDCVDSQGWTPLIKACGIGKPDVVEFLVGQGADPNKHRELFTPLMTCCTYTLVSEDLKLSCASILLEHGAQVNAKDKYQTTALMYASGSGYKDIVARLLEVPKININMQDKEGWTALFYAVNQQNMDIVSLLVLAGTDINLKDRYNRTVITLALDKGFKAIANALGYVEEKILPDPKPKKKLRNKFLAELPDSNGNGGFNSDAKKILEAFRQFKVKKISLPDLLNATSQDLYNIGVKLKPDIEKILKNGIHRYHLYPWSNSSRHEVKKGVSMTMEDAIAITGAIAKNLTIINASVRYVDTRISSRRYSYVAYSSMESSFLKSLVNTYHLNERIRVCLTRINNRVKQIKPEIPADFITTQEKKPEKKLVKFFCYAVLAASTGYLICNYNSHFPFKIGSLLSFYCPFWFQNGNLINGEHNRAVSRLNTGQVFEMLSFFSE